MLQHINIEMIRYYLDYGVMYVPLIMSVLSLFSSQIRASLRSYRTAALLTLFTVLMVWMQYKDVAILKAASYFFVYIFTCCVLVNVRVRDDLNHHQTLVIHFLLFVMCTSLLVLWLTNVDHLGYTTASLVDWNLPIHKNKETCRSLYSSAAYLFERPTLALLVMACCLGYNSPWLWVHDWALLTFTLGLSMPYINWHLFWYQNDYFYTHFFLGFWTVHVLLVTLWFFINKTPNTKFPNIPWFLVILLAHFIYLMFCHVLPKADGELKRMVMDHVLFQMTVHWILWVLCLLSLYVLAHHVRILYYPEPLLQYSLPSGSLMKQLLDTIKHRCSTAAASQYLSFTLATVSLILTHGLYFGFGEYDDSMIFLFLSISFVAFSFLKTYVLFLEPDRAPGALNLSLLQKVNIYLMFLTSHLIRITYQNWWLSLVYMLIYLVMELIFYRLRWKISVKRNDSEAIHSLAFYESQPVLYALWTGALKALDNLRRTADQHRGEWLPLLPPYLQIFYTWLFPPKNPFT